MTKDEIMNMPAGQEMDVLIAEKVMGWHAVMENGFNHWVNVDGGFQCGVAPYDGFEDEEDFHTLKWHPSESILWAWEVVEKLHPNCSFLLDYDDPQTIESLKWCCLFFDKDEPYKEYEARANTAPLAICRAALLAIL
jgi:hypothetical protein